LWALFPNPVAKKFAEMSIKNDTNGDENRLAILCANMPEPTQIYDG